MDTGDPEVDRSLRAPNVYPPDLYELTFNNGNTRGYLHWVMGVGDPEAFERSVLSGRRNEVPGPPRSGGTNDVQGFEVSFYEFRGQRGGSNSGHVIAVIGVDDLIAYGSVHGSSHRDYAVALAVDAAQQIEAQERS